MWDFYLINVTDASEAEIRIVFRRLALFSSFVIRFIELKLSGISSTICSGPSFSKLLS